MKLKLPPKVISMLAAAAIVVAVPANALAAALSTAQLSTLPHFSGTSYTQGREPVTFIYIGTEQQIIDQFISHGWNGSDPLTPTSIYRAYQAAKTNSPYPTAPFSPAFIDGDRPDLTFQQSTAANTIAERHHTRIWLTSQTTSDGRPVWVGTASFDNGLLAVQTEDSTIPVAHSIDPKLDAERSFIIKSLGLKKVTYVRFNPRSSGTNTLGSNWYTDGRAALVDMDKQSATAKPAPTPNTTPAPAPKTVTLSIPSSTTTSSWWAEAKAKFNSLWD